MTCYPKRFLSILALSFLAAAPSFSVEAVFSTSNVSQPQLAKKYQPSSYKHSRRIDRGSKARQDRLRKGARRVKKDLDSNQNVDRLKKRRKALRNKRNELREERKLKMKERQNPGNDTSMSTMSMEEINQFQYRSGRSSEPGLMEFTTTMEVKPADWGSAPKVVQPAEYEGKRTTRARLGRRQKMHVQGSS